MVIAVAEDAVPIIDLTPVLDVFAELFGFDVSMQEGVSPASDRFSCRGP
jgi:hypothetical protein